MLHREKRTRVCHGRRRAGRDEPRGRVQGDEVITSGLGRPGDERDEPGSGGQDGRDRDSRYAPPSGVISIPR